jgi:DNA recombination protein RmuC
METTLLLIVICLIIIGLVLFLTRKPDNNKEDFINLRNQISATEQSIRQMEFSEKEEFRQNRKEISEQLKSNRDEMANSLQVFRGELLQSLKTFQDSFDQNVKSFNDLQKEKFGSMETKQTELILSTENRLEKMRETVDEKLQKTLNERLGQSFELVSKQLKDVEQGLGEMKTLASDVGGLKKVLSNVKMRGGIGEVQLAMLLEQVLAPDQYEANVKTKHGSADIVEFAIKLPGRDEDLTTVYLPIDAKFPKDVYEQVVDAYETADPVLIEAASKNIESVIKKMAKDIRDKYIDPPHTTDFGIMFLPFEGIYAEVVRRAALLDQLQREFKVIVTGPTTLAAILNSLQMGFRTLAIQKRSSEVWKVLGAVKNEFENFGGMLEKAHKEITKAGDTIEELRGKRTRAINRRLKEVEALPAREGREMLPENSSGEVLDEDDDL